jgi:hypothetical protein
MELRGGGCHPVGIAIAGLQQRQPFRRGEVAQVLTYALRFGSDGKPRRTGWDFAAPLAAARLVRHLTLSGFIVMRRPPQRPHSGPP